MTINNTVQENMVKRIIVSFGLALITIGILCVLKPAYPMDFLGFDKDIARIFGAVLIFVGCMDVFIIPQILTKNINRNKEHDKPN